MRVLPVKPVAAGFALCRNINRWLADNCFEDYYTRNGLDDPELHKRQAVQTKD